MFGFLKKKKHSLVSNAVYMERKIADYSLVRAVTSAEVPVIIVSFFPVSLSRVDYELKYINIEGRKVDAASLPTSGLTETPWLLNAGEIAAATGFENWLNRRTSPVLFLFVEHYPLFSVEKAALDVLRKAPRTAVKDVVFYTGLDEPFLHAFGGQNLIKKMYALGMEPPLRIYHPMVDKALASAARKIEKRVRRPVPANSDANWFRSNLPA